MSTRTGGRWTNDPDAPSDTRCRWALCAQPVPYRFKDEGMDLCRDHGLLAWAIVNTQMQADVPPTPTPEVEGPTVEPIGFVYFIATGGRIKIGYTSDLERRLATYPPNMEIIHVKVGGKDVEKREHRRFGEWLTDGREWFEDCAAVRALINEIAQDDPHWREIEPMRYFTPRRKPTASRVEIRRITA